MARNRAAMNSKQARTYWALVCVMFQGALSDNIYRFILVMLLLDAASAATETLAEANAMGAFYQQFVGIAIALPWIVAVTVAGWMSSRYSKAAVTQWTKLMEVGVMFVAAVVFWMGSVWLGIFVLFLMFLQSALFGPAKYGILPEVLPAERVGWGTGILQAFTFVSILVGTIVGPWLYGVLRNDLWIAGVILMALAVVGYGVAMLMHPIRPANPHEVFHLNPIVSLSPYLKAIRESAALRWPILCNAVFWGVALMLQFGAAQLLKLALGLTDANVGLAMVPIVIGNGVGCFLASWLSRSGIALWSVPWFAAGMVIFSGMMLGFIPGVEMLETMDPAARARLVWVASPLLGLIGTCAGALVVPLQSWIVAESDPELRSGIWATNNLLVAFGWIAAGPVFNLVTMIRNNPADVFLAGGLIVLVMVLIAGTVFRPLRGWRS
jgi:acyl-[acyl-carrier-protein]-phospholipid O-acyltransferase/long-chain-fatty-acid--[acyl-carrier-protein] ligase